MRRKRKSRKAAGSLIRTIRKPTAPPTRVEAEQLKYDRARERARLRRAGVSEDDASKAAESRPRRQAARGADEDGHAGSGETPANT